MEFQRREALEECDSVQRNIDSLDERASAEILVVQKRLKTAEKPVFDRRNRLIQKVSNFWITAFINHPLMSAIIDGEEEDCLHYLKKIDVEDMEFGFRIRFHFSANPYFENDVLTKEYYTRCQVPSCRMTRINWKKGESIVTNIRQREEKAKSQGRKRAAEKRTFFTWYEESSNPMNDEVAEVIRGDLWPNPLSYYVSPDIEFPEIQEPEEKKNEDANDSCSSESTIMYEEDEDGELIRVKQNKPDVPKAESLKDELKTSNEECSENYEPISISESEPITIDSKSELDPLDTSIEY